VACICAFVPTKPFADAIENPSITVKECVAAAHVLQVIQTLRIARMDGMRALLWCLLLCQGLTRGQTCGLASLVSSWFRSGLAFCCNSWRRHQQPFKEPGATFIRPLPLLAHIHTHPGERRPQNCSMAALTAAKAAPSVGSSKQSISRIPTCSARVKPFTPAFKASRAQQKRQNLACRAAEEEEAAEAAEAAAPVDDFEFNYSDAKKNNSYTQGDVDSILEAYAEGSGEMAFNDEFFVNITDLEDAAIFEDVDNRDGYEDDMYSSAGIPEAAPVQKRGPRFGAKAENENEDDEAFRSALEPFT
jgi:hypothetical protein